MKIIELEHRLYQWVQKLSLLLAGTETLFINDDIMADGSLDRRGQPLLKLAISRRQPKHYILLIIVLFDGINKSKRAS